ncbi:hypothetical protein PR202_ga00308 [Eleusine coracana subsp. coracana]|uniref:Uncharacterized protein n=1 Tax=Eleusine coracana subsp. coracana TaxID=191504 RepID=A0AAV5BDZ9_ELECO|nr:hypothetical protein PR202_ga00308 [Eleusine coracana subsp. coracana]
MVVSLLRQIKDALGPLHGKGEVIQDLEFALITKGDMTRREALWLEAIRLIAREGFISGFAMYSFLGWFGQGIGALETVEGSIYELFKIHHIC